jgi:splicing factor U2AF subunit
VHIFGGETDDSVMAEHLASIFGTEKDRVNCPFYFKIGACRHGDRCSRMHNRPTISPTLLFSNMYQRPDMAISGTDPHAQNMDPRRLQEHFEDFYEDLFEELSKYGELESLNVCDNLADHMVFENLFLIAKVLNCSSRWHFFIVKDSISNALDPEYV